MINLPVLQDICNESECKSACVGVEQISACAAGTVVVCESVSWVDYTPMLEVDHLTAVDRS